MASITSTTINRIHASNPHFIDTNRSPTKDIKYIIKRYHNGDIKLKVLNNPVTVKRGGYEEVFYKTHTTPSDDIFNRYTKHYKFFFHKDVEKNSPPSYGIDYKNKLVLDEYGNPLENSNTVLEDGRTFYEKIAYKKYTNNQRAARRAISNIYDILYGRSFDWFLTVTFDDKKIDRTDPSACSKRLRKFLNHLQERYYNILEYFAVWEYHKDMNAIHYHILLKNIDPHEFTPALDPREFLTSKNGKTRKNPNYNSQLITKNKLPIYNFPRIKFGYTTATKINHNNKTLSYITKYILKQYKGNYVPYAPNVRRYIHSRSLSSPKKLTLCERDYNKLFPPAPGGEGAENTSYSAPAPLGPYASGPSLLSGPGSLETVTKSGPDASCWPSAFTLYHWLLQGTDNFDFTYADIIQNSDEENSRNLIALFRHDRHENPPVHVCSETADEADWF